MLHCRVSAIPKEMPEPFAQGRHVGTLALPDHEHPPAKIFQGNKLSTITKDIPGKFSLPEAAIFPVHAAEISRRTFWVDVPEATVNENRFLHSRKSNVR